MPVALAGPLACGQAQQIDAELVQAGGVAQLPAVPRAAGLIVGRRIAGAVPGRGCVGVDLGHACARRESGTLVRVPEEAAMLPATAVARSVGGGVDAGEPHVEQWVGRPGQRTAVIANPVTRGQAAAAALQCCATKSACPGMPATARRISVRRLPINSRNCVGCSASARRW